MKNFFINFVIISILLIFTGCLTLKEKYSNNSKEEIFCEIKIFSDKSKKDIVLLRSNLFPSTDFWGELKIEENGEKNILITKIYFLTTGSVSYTEGKLNCYALFKLYEENGKYFIELLEKLEFFDFEYGLIRYKDSYIRNENGKQKVKERFDRIEAYSNFLRDVFSEEKIFGQYITKSMKYNKISLYERIKILFFPELYGFSYLNKNNLLSKKVQLNELNKKDNYIFADSIGYNKTYTEKVFPENLRELRNSGTMLNDFESTFDLFVTMYNINALNNNILKKVPLNKIEKVKK